MCSTAFAAETLPFLAVLRLITNSPVETEMLARATQKLQMDEEIIQSAMFNNNHSAADEAKRQKRLRELVEGDSGEKEDPAEAEEESDVMSWEELNTMLARSPEEFNAFEKMDDDMKKVAVRTKRPRLMTEKECPKWMVEQKAVVDPIGLQSHGRGQRETKATSYKDMNEREFDKFLEGGGETNPNAASGSAAGPGGKKSKGKGGSKKGGAAGSGLALLTTTAGADAQKDMMRSAIRKVKKCKVSCGTAFPLCSHCLSSLRHYLLLAVRLVLQEPETGRERCGLFLEKPPLDTPEYYNIILRPISLMEISNSIESGALRPANAAAGVGVGAAAAAAAAAGAGAGAGTNIPLASIILLLHLDTERDAAR